MPMMWRLTTLALAAALYLAPFLAGLGRWRRDPESAASPQLIFSINLLLGWTVIGWLVAWWLAFRRTPLPTLPQGGWVGPLPDRPIWPGDEPDPGTSSSYEPGPNQPAATSWYDPGQPKAICPTCNGTGRMRCPSCFGKGTWWVPPTTSTGTGHQERDTYCQGSGTVQCTGPGPHS